MVMAPTSIVKAREDQAELLAAILADSFEHDPVMNWVIPDPSLYHGFFKLLSQQLILPNGHAYLDSQERGAALWLPPGVHFDVPTNWQQIWMVLKLVVKKGFKVLPRLEAVQETMSRLHPTEPHYYLQSVGARQANQGQGVGSALIKQVTRICDEEQLPAYLESSSERNVPLYERHGFETFHEEQLGGNGPTMWFMLRSPRQD